MPMVKVGETESLESALRRFKKKCQRSGILTEVKRRQYFEKPSIKRKKKLLAAKRKSRKRY